MSPCGGKESNTTEQLNTQTFVCYIICLFVTLFSSFLYFLNVFKFRFSGKERGKKGDIRASGLSGSGTVLGVEWGGERDPSTGAPPFCRNEGKRSLERQMRKLKLRLSDLSF